MGQIPYAHYKAKALQILPVLCGRWYDLYMWLRVHLSKTVQEIFAFLIGISEGALIDKEEYFQI